MESVWSVSKLSTESVGSRRELVANCVYDADVTQLDSFVASAVCNGHNVANGYGGIDEGPWTKLGRAV